jgi:HSP20 family protein
MLSRFLTPLSSHRSVRSVDPFQELHREMNRLFDDFLTGSPTNESQRALIAAPKLDIRESEHELTICAELPGVKPNEVDVQLDGDVLTIRGEKRNEAQHDKGGYHVMERSFGQFHRALQLPFTPNPDQVAANFDNGVLNIRIPKAGEQERGRRIQIESSGSDSHQTQAAGNANASDDKDVKH